MTFHVRTILAVVSFASCHVASAAAQSVDSVALGIASPYTWKGYDRSPGMVLTGTAAIGLAGFSQNGNAGERRNVSLELAAWVPPSQRSLRRRYDQYLASFGYGYCVAACDQPMWSRRTTVTLSANGYWLPNSPADAWSPTIEAMVRHYEVQEKLGQRQFGFNLSSFLSAERGFRQYEGTLVRGGAGTALGPMHSLTFSLDAALAGSDWPARSGAERRFGFHYADVQLGVEADKAIGFTQHLSSKLVFGAEIPATQIGAVRGVVTLRFNVLPVYPL